MQPPDVVAFHFTFHSSLLRSFLSWGGGQSQVHYSVRFGAFRRQIIGECVIYIQKEGKYRVCAQACTHACMLVSVCVFGWGKEVR